MPVLAVVLFATSFVALAYHDLQAQIAAIDVSDQLGTDRPTREESVPDDYEGHAINILVLGSDSRSGSNNVDGAEGKEDVLVARSDTAMIMHVSADRSRIDVVSIPRDTIVNIPACQRKDGSQSEPMRSMFNTAFANGAGTGNDVQAIADGAACAWKTAEEMTDIHIDEFIVVDFNGMKNMVESLGGVTVYVDEEINDPQYTRLNLPVGCHHLSGQQALDYARVRYGVGDGSDINRIARQQNLMSAMFRALQAKNMLTSADDLYSFTRSALGTLTTSERIGSLTTLAGLGSSVANVGMDNINFITMPNTPAPGDLNRVVPSDDADDVWQALKHDRPVPEEALMPETGAPAEDGGEPAEGGAGEPTGQTETTEPAPAQEGSEGDTGMAPAPATPTPTEDPAAQCYANVH